MAASATAISGFRNLRYLLCGGTERGRVGLNSCFVLKNTPLRIFDKIVPQVIFIIIIIMQLCAIPAMFLCITNTEIMHLVRNLYMASLYECISSVLPEGSRLCCAGHGLWPP